MTDMNEATRTFRKALEECNVDYGRVSIANDLLFWADCHADTYDEKVTLIQSAYDEAVAILDAMREAIQ